MSHFRAGFSGCGIIRHPKHAGWFLKHDGGNNWSYTDKLWESVIMWDDDLATMLRRIIGATWTPTKPWHEMPDGSCQNGWKDPIPKGR